MQNQDSKEFVQLNKSVLKTLVRCCMHKHALHLNPINRELITKDNPYYDVFCCGFTKVKDETTGEGKLTRCLCPGYSDKSGITIIYCPECLGEVPMGSGGELIHSDGCPNSEVGFRGHHKWRHAYKSERECGDPTEYMAQFEIIPEGM